MGFMNSIKTFMGGKKKGSKSRRKHGGAELSTGSTLGYQNVNSNSLIGGANAPPILSNLLQANTGITGQTGGSNAPPPNITELLKGLQGGDLFQGSSPLEYEGGHKSRSRQRKSRQRKSRQSKSRQSRSRQSRSRQSRSRQSRSRRGGAFASAAAEYSPSYPGYEANVLQPGQGPLTTGMISDAGSGMIGGRRHRRRKCSRRRHRS